MERSQSV